MEGIRRGWKGEMERDAEDGGVMGRGGKYATSKHTSLEFVLLCSAELVVAGGGALLCGVLEGVLCNMTCYHGNKGCKRVSCSVAVYTCTHNVRE